MASGRALPRVGFIVSNIARPAANVVAFYNKRGTCEQWVKEGKGAIRCTRLCAARSPPTPCGSSFMPSPIISATSCALLATPEPIKDWSLTSLRGIPWRAIASRPDPEHIYKPRRDLNDISVLPKVFAIGTVLIGTRLSSGECRIQ
jgi:hypothetical protein